MKTAVKILFILPPECQSDGQTNEETQQAFEVCKKNKLNASWCKEHESTDLQLAKTDIVVFQKFEGDAFEKLKNLKCVRIVGPWCLLACLTKDQQIPNYPWPIFSMAMHDCTISASSFPKPMRKLIQSKVEYMGGYFSANLTENTTYLVTDSVKSEKYIKAAEANVKIVLNLWVDDVWEQCQKSNILCTDIQFEKHKCPIFHKLVICCTGFNFQKRLELKNMIMENGGTYNEQLHIRSTDFLVCESGETSAKYKAARKHNIPCVSMAWVSESVRSGYCLSDVEYKTVVGTSTPTKDGENMPPNFSMISCIGNQSTQYSSTIDMTNVTSLLNCTPVKEKQTTKRKSDSSERDALIDGIDLKQVKKAGAFLDGCGVYLVGFNGERREKLCKVLNFSGATRYDDISERVTHVIVGDEFCLELKALAMRISMSDCVLVNIHWLLESMNKQQPVDEQNFIINPANFVNEPSSPLSKKGLHVLRTKNNTPSQDINIPILQTQSEPEVDIVQQYLQNPSSQEDTLVKLLLKDAENFDSKPNFSLSSRQSPVPQSNSQATEASSAVDDSSSQQFLPIFSSFKFMVLNFTEGEQNSVVLAIEAMAGKVVSKSYKGIPDYIVVPVFSTEIKQTANEIVNDLWISECWQENELRPIEYFHKPIAVKENIDVLKDCVVTISSYINYERNFLKNLIMRLGGVCQEQFSRIESVKNNIVASTHLVSPEASGRKYAAAIKWGLPVVNKDWLLECARLSCLINETPYLVGDAKCENLQKSIKSLNNINSTNGLISASTLVKTPVQKLSAESAVETPKSHAQQKSCDNTPSRREKLNSTDSEHTPVNRLIRNVQNMSGVCSQITPVQKILAEARKNNLLGTPEQSLPLPTPWDHIDTPETPLGAFIRPNPSPELRKEMVRFLNTFPEHKHRRDSTPLSELKRQLWCKVLHEQEIVPPKQPNFDAVDENKSTEQQSFTASDDFRTPPRPQDHWHHLKSLITNSGSGLGNSNRQSIVPITELSEFKNNTSGGEVAAMPMAAIADPAKDSQPNTVSWEDEFMDIENGEKRMQQSIPVFMLSGIEKERREELVNQIESLGGLVTNLSNFDPMCTHLICPKPTRNEKILACMAAGKWILHPSYLEQCILEGKLINEEPYEFGNPESLRNGQMQHDKENENRFSAIHYWRKEINRRGYGAFHDVRAIVLAQKKDSIVRIIEAGGGVVVDASPPFTDTIHATHCLINFKSVTDISEYLPLAEQGIFCVNCIYVNDLLHKTANDIKDYILPQLKEYYEIR